MESCDCSDRLETVSCMCVSLTLSTLGSLLLPYPCPPTYVLDPSHSSFLSQDTRLILTFPVPQHINCYMPTFPFLLQFLLSLPLYPDPIPIPSTSFFLISDFLSGPFPSFISSPSPRHQFPPLLFTINIYPNPFLFFPAAPSPGFRT